MFEGYGAGGSDRFDFIDGIVVGSYEDWLDKFACGFLDIGAKIVVGNLGRCFNWGGNYGFNGGGKDGWIVVTSVKGRFFSTGSGKGRFIWIFGRNC